MTGSPTRRRRGFSLTELLVVIGIIVLLVSIGLPTYFAVRRNSDIARTRLDLRTLEMGLEEYNRVFNAYPRRAPVNATVNQGADFERVLFKYLISNYRWDDDTEDISKMGVGPMHPGPDLRPGSQDDVPIGRTWGPFVSPDKFKLYKRGKNRGLLDRFGVEILYYPKWNFATNPTGSNTLVGRIDTNRALFNEYDGPADNDLKGQFRWMLGAKRNAPNENPELDPGNATPNNLAAAGDLTFNGPFVLISAGPDRKWVPQDKAKNRRKCDDVYNFEHP